MSNNIKLGNTSQSIVNVPSSFFTNGLKPVELFNLTVKDKYFKEKTLFSQARLLNINNNPVKNYRKYDEYNIKKYIPLHKQPNIPPPENIFNPHYRRNYSVQNKKVLAQSILNEATLDTDEHKFIDEDQALENNFNLFANITLGDEDEESKKHKNYAKLMLERNSNFNMTEYKVHKKERYNKNYQKYEEDIENSKSRKSILRSQRPRRSTNSIDKNESQEESNEKIQQAKTINNSISKKSIFKSVQKANPTQNPSFNILNKLEQDYKNLEEYYQKGTSFNKNNFVSDFRLKMNNLLDKINSNFDTEKWMNTDFKSIFNKMNDNMFTPITYYNSNNESETAKFRYTLQEKIKNLSLPNDKKVILLEQFNKTTMYKDLEDGIPKGKQAMTAIEEARRDQNKKYNLLIRDEQEEVDRQIEDFKSSTMFSLQNNIETNHINMKRIAEYALPKINNNNLEKINRENKILYDRFIPSKLYSGLISPTLSEFTIKNGEKYSNRSKLREKNQFVNLYKKEVESKDTQETNNIKFNFENKNKYKELKL